MKLELFFNKTQIRTNWRAGENSVPPTPSLFARLFLIACGEIGGRAYFIGAPLQILIHNKPKKTSIFLNNSSYVIISTSLLL